MWSWSRTCSSACKAAGRSCCSALWKEAVCSMMPRRELNRYFHMWLNFSVVFIRAFNSISCSVHVLYFIISSMKLGINWWSGWMNRSSLLTQTGKFPTIPTKSRGSWRNTRWLDIIWTTSNNWVGIQHLLHWMRAHLYTLSVDVEQTILVSVRVIMHEGWEQTAMTPPVKAIDGIYRIQ